MHNQLYLTAEISDVLYAEMIVHHSPSSHLLPHCFSSTIHAYNPKSMLALRIPPSLRLPPPISAAKPKPLPPVLPLQNPNFPSLSIYPPKSRRKLSLTFAQNGDGEENKELPKENGGGEEAKNERPRLNLRWADLLLDRDPDNIVAVGLTGLLTWASVQVLWQLFVISAAIVLAALKYTIVAALLVFVLITLL